MNLALALLLIACTVLTACESPENQRHRGSGSGADIGNRGKVVEMHEGSQPFWKTPQIVSTKHPPLKPARQADELSRR